MPIFRSMLVTLSGDPFSRGVLTIIRNLDFSPRTEIILVRIIPCTRSATKRSMSQPLPPSRSFPRDRVRRRLRTYTTRLATMTSSTVRVMRKRTSARVVQLTGVRKTSLVILNDQKLAKISQVLTNSIDDQIIRRTPYAIVIIGP